MSQEDQQFDKNEQDSTLDETRESEDESELDSLFAEDEEGDESTPVTRAEYENLKKGAQKLATELGRLKKEKATKTEVKEVEPVIKTESTDDMTEFFLEQTPKAELVKDKLTQVAKALYGGSIIKAWRNESWIRELADKQADEKSEEETNKSKISKPNSGTAPSKVDISKVKPEEVEKLTPSQKMEWLKAQSTRG